MAGNFLRNISEDGMESRIQQQQKCNVFILGLQQPHIQQSALEHLDIDG